ncbi:MAG: SurA N-terminal domain-containing protein [Gemmatimonadota bacterium]|nr:SurA N-terminal domain-containing protein [Gemmatimonadota bacterium]
MMTNLRDNMKIIFFILIVFFVGWMAVTLTGLDDYLIQQNREEMRGMKDAGSVDGKPIERAQYTQAVQNQVAMASDRRAGAGISSWEVDQIAEQVWTNLVTEKVMAKVLRDHRISVSTGEVVEYIKANPLPELRQQPTLLTDGQFDFDKYHAILADPQALGLVLQLEQDAREKLKNAKLFFQISALFKLTDAQLIRAYKAQEEKARVNYVHFSSDSLVGDDEAKASAEEIKTYYEENLKLFKRPDMAGMTYLLIPVTPGPEDSVAVRDTMEMLLTRLNTGMPFDSLARLYSQGSLASSGGDLGWFARGDFSDSLMVKLAFSLRRGRVSKPVFTSAGMQIIRVDSTRRKDGKRQVKARRILRPVEAGPKRVKQIGARARILRKVMRDSTVLFSKIAADSGFAAIPTGLVAIGGRIPGIQANRELIDFLYGSPVGSLSYPINILTSGMAPAKTIMLARLDERKERGTIPLEETTGEIAGLLMAKKKKEILGKRIELLTAGCQDFDSLAAFAAEKGYELQRSPEFSRSIGLPLIGRENAFTGAAFGLPTGKISHPVEANGDYYLLEVVERKEADMEGFEKQRESLAMQLRNSMMRSCFSRFSEELYDKTEIKDFRRLPPVKTDSLAQASM